MKKKARSKQQAGAVKNIFGSMFGGKDPEDMMEEFRPPTVDEIADRVVQKLTDKYEEDESGINYDKLADKVAARLKKGDD